VGEGRAVAAARDLEHRWEAVRGRMEAASDILCWQGSVASRLTRGGLRVFSIRFVEQVNGGRRQRAIYLGADAELVHCARALIGAYRERVRQTREVEEAARFAAASGAFLRRLLTSRHARPTRLGKS